MSRFRKKINGMSVWKKILMIGVLFAVFGLTVAARMEEGVITKLRVRTITMLGGEAYPSIEVDAIIQNEATPTVVDLAGTSVYTISQDEGSLFWIDDHESTDGTRVASGVSILFPKITEAMDDWEVTIMKKPVPWSGTTKIVISSTAWASGTTDHFWNVTTGVTHESSGKVPCEISEIDAVGDWLKFKVDYSSTGSTIYQIGRYIQ